MTVKKASSLKTEGMKCNGLTIAETPNSVQPEKRCGNLHPADGGKGVAQRGKEPQGPEVRETSSPELGKSTDGHAAYRSFHK